MPKPQIEYRIVCKHFGTRGHSGHEVTKRGKGAGAKARKALKDQNDHAARSPIGHWYRGEAPYKLQTREVTPWKDNK